MNRYLYETHLHTMEASACASMDGAEHVRRYKEAGYSGIIVTDHFFNGNSCIPKDLPWEERVDQFCRGYQNAKKEGDRIGLSVFFGWEANFYGTEFLIYGLDKDWLKSHPNMLSWNVEKQYRMIHAAGGFVVHAHPFRIRPYIKEVRLYPKFVDAVEVINVGNRSKEFDEKAADYARKNKLIEMAGTDAHGYDNCRSGIALEHNINSIHDLLKQVKENKHELLNIQY